MSGGWAFSALILGLVGSLHCVGMCGPLALALPTGKLKPAQKIIANLLYPLGRIFTYAILGALAGIFGAGFSLVGLQQPLSIAAGLLLLIITLLPRIKNQIFQIKGGSALSATLASWWRKPGMGKFFVVGLLNGLLPCGMVYAALLGSLITASASGSAVYMALFGLGTTPALTAMVLGGSWMQQKAGSFLRKLVPLVALSFAVLFILRGLGLSIPYLSPPVQSLEVQTPHSPAASCH